MAVSVKNCYGQGQQIEELGLWHDGKILVVTSRKNDNDDVFEILCWSKAVMKTSHIHTVDVLYLLLCLVCCCLVSHCSCMLYKQCDMYAYVSAGLSRR
jgi:hypothetical protein